MAAEHMPENDVALAIDTGGTNVRAALVMAGRGIIVETSMPIDSFGSKDALADALISSYDSMMHDYEISRQRLAGVGHGSAGVPDVKNMWFTNSPNMPKEFLPLDMAPRIADRYGLNTMAVLNDCSAGAFGEYGFGWKPEDVRNLPKKRCSKPGAFRISVNQKIPKDGFERVCYYTISTGENAGFVKNGEVFGRPELGHMFYGERDFYGRPARCGCNALGCMEAVHSGTALGRMILEEYRHGSGHGDSRLFAEIARRIGQQATEDQLVKEIPVMLYRAARNGDRHAREISEWHNLITCRHIGNILASGYQPQIIAFGGSVTKSMDFSMWPAFRMLAESVARGSRNYIGNQPEAELPVLAVCKGYGDDHILYGAGASVLSGRLYGGDV